MLPDKALPNGLLPGVWPNHWSVAFMPGSLPMGGSVEMTPIHAFSSAPVPLQIQRQPQLNPQRRDIDLGYSLAFVIDDVVTAREADTIVEASERFGYRNEAPGICTPPGMRMNKSVHWVSDTALTEPLFARIAHLLPQRIDGAQLHAGFSQRFNMYRYDAEDVFNRHTDGSWPGYGLSPDRTQMIQWPTNIRSALTMLLYLNGSADGVKGGNTRLFDVDGEAIDVVPTKGSALFFRHGFGADSVMHEGCRVSGNVAKYVARINVMYAA